MKMREKGKGPHDFKIRDKRAKDPDQRLVPLDVLDNFEVADDSIDVRGWDVFGENGIKIGEVDELIVDIAEMKVRYLQMMLNKELLSKDDNAHLLIPIGVAQIDEENDDIWVDALDITALMKSPLYRGGPITREYENKIRQALRPDWQHREYEIDREYYNESDYDEAKFYERRRRMPGRSDTF